MKDSFNLERFPQASSRFRVIGVIQFIGINIKVYLEILASLESQYVLKMLLFIIDIMRN